MTNDRRDLEDIGVPKGEGTDMGEIDKEATVPVSDLREYHTELETAVAVARAKGETQMADTVQGVADDFESELIEEHTND